MADAELARAEARALAPSALAFMEDVAHLAVVEPPPLPVHLAWSAVQEDVRAIEKSSHNTDQGFNFRGYDDVINVVGPVLRKHGVVIMPRTVKLSSERYQSAGGRGMRNVTVEMAYTVIGPAGDTLEGSSYGEAADIGDKATAKAQTVALRVFLIQGLSIPTQELDPDARSHERQERNPHVQEELDVLDAVLAQRGFRRADAMRRFYDQHLYDIRACTDPDLIRELTDHYRDQPDDDGTGAPEWTSP